METKTVVTQNRFKSKWLWAALLAQVVSLLQFTGALEAWGLDIGLVNDVIAGVLQLLVLVGILNNATDAENW